MSAFNPTPSRMQANAVTPQGLVRCTALSLESAAPDLWRVLRELAVEVENVNALVVALRAQSHYLNMDASRQLNGAGEANMCRAAADVVNGWLQLTWGSSPIRHPETVEELEQLASSFERHLKLHWRAACTRAWSQATPPSLRDIRAA